MRKKFLIIVSLLILWLLVSIIRQPSDSSIRFMEKQDQIAEPHRAE